MKKFYGLKKTFAGKFYKNFQEVLAAVQLFNLNLHPLLDVNPLTHICNVWCEGNCN